MSFLVLGKERSCTEFLVSFKPLLKVLPHADTILLLLLTLLEGHKFVSNLMHVQTVFQNAAY